MIDQYNIVGEILFSQSLFEIQQQLESLRKDSFDPLDRIVIKQDIVDDYPYVDAVGTKLIEIQKLINQVDISNCFILLVTANPDVVHEIDFITKFYSVDTNPIDFMLVDGEYVKEVKKYPNTACQKLWNHFYVGTDGNINPCCVADHRFPLGNINDIGVNDTVEKNAEKIRSAMVQGYRDRACSACYEKEDNNVQSLRRSCDPSDQSPQIQHLDIRLNNICNFKCRMCSEYFSSAIQQETIEIYGKNPVMGFEKTSLTRDAKYLKDQQLKQVLPLITQNIRSAYFAGGEPLITREHYEVLEKLIEIQNTNLAIKYNTNLSTLFYKQWNVIDKWKQFTDVTVGASIDASGSVAEYMRHGTIWKDIVDNIYTIKKHVPHVKLKIESTVSLLTIENLIDLQNDWINQRLFDINDFQVKVLTDPNFLSPAALPRYHKDRLSSIMQTHIQKFEGTRLAKQWGDVLHWMNNNDYTFALKYFAHRTRVLDAHRKESFQAIFPEYKDLI